MKAVLTDARFSDPAWIFERKLDGIRCVAIRDRRRPAAAVAQRPLASPAAIPRSPPRSPPSPASASPSTARSWPSRARRRASRGSPSAGTARVAVHFYVFDVLWLDGYDVRELPLRSASALLRGALRYEDPIRLTPYRNGDGEAFYAEACRQGWEGLIAKRADSPYRDARSRDWLKFKCEQGQELVIGGYTAPRGSRTDFGALLVGALRRRQAALRGQGRHGLRPRDAARHRRAARAAAARTTRRSPTPIRERDVDVGRAGARRAGRLHRVDARTGACATRASSACATTRRRGTWCARRPRGDGPPGEHARRLTRPAPGARSGGATPRGAPRFSSAPRPSPPRAHAPRRPGACRAGRRAARPHPRSAPSPAARRTARRPRATARTAPRRPR